MSIFDTYIDGVKQPLVVDWDLIRMTRNLHLIETDNRLLGDYPITEEQRAELIAHRQVLRDLPQTYETAEEAADNYPGLPAWL